MTKDQRIKQLEERLEETFNTFHKFSGLSVYMPDWVRDEPSLAEYVEAIDKFRQGKAA